MQSVMRQCYVNFKPITVINVFVNRHRNEVMMKLYKIDFGDVSQSIKRGVFYDYYIYKVIASSG